MKESTVIGVDVGSVSVAMAKINGEGKVLASSYAFHHGNIKTTYRKLFAALCGQNGDSGQNRENLLVCATSSTPASIPAHRRVDNQIAIIETVSRFHSDVAAVLLVGGEKFFLSRFNEQGEYQGTVSNTSCAAGTGSFLDQQATRLKMASAEELCATALQNRGKCPKIASRCAVFAKTDLIHAQQEGYGYEEICDGLCRGLARNIVDTLFSSGTPQGKILFCGGVAKNGAVTKHIEDLAGILLTVPDSGHLYGAIGAALTLLKELESDDLVSSGAKEVSLHVVEKASEKKYSYPPLTLNLSVYPDFLSRKRYLFSLETTNPVNPVEVDIYEDLAGISNVWLGVDIGSTSTKAVLVDDRQEVLVGLYTRTAGRPLVAVQSIFAAIDDIWGREKQTLVVAGCATTGSGRKFIGAIVGADAVIDEITAHARAAVQINPQVDTIIEIGGQDAKFTTLHNGRVTSSIMNNVCAAGTGSFIEEQAARLGCKVEDYSRRTEHVRAPLASDRCTVFMERDINHHLSEGFSVDEVLASALHSVRENYLMKVAVEKNIGDVIFFQGATAKNKALVAAFEQRLGKPLLVSKFCHLTGAYGAALIGAEEQQGASVFKGIALYRENIDVTTEVCELCNNHCKISVAEGGNGKVAYGFLCGRDYETRHYVAREHHERDLLKMRRRLLEQVTFSRETQDGRCDDITIGLPYGLHMVDDFHLWTHFFQRLSIKTVSSASFADGLGRGKKISKSEFCAPITALHGHVEWLLERADYVFLPFYLENKNKKGRRQFCYYTQFVPGVIGSMSEESFDHVLSPVVRYLYSPFHVKMQLYRMLQRIMKRAPGFLEVANAYESALAYDKRYRAALQEHYRTCQRKKDDVEVVLLGRPYTVLSETMNCSIPRLFSEQHVRVFFQDMVPYDREEVSEIEPLLEELHWHYAARILEVATVICRRKGVYPVYVTSFKCSPDSFVLDYFKTIMDACNKPYLILELDGHDSSVGYETRIEAAVRSFRNHLKENGPSHPPLNLRMVNPDFTSEIGSRHILLPNWDSITSTFLVALLKREGYEASIIEETEETIRQGLKYNSGQCIPLNAITEGLVHTMKKKGLLASETLLWMGESSLACNIRLYPHHIKTILGKRGLGDVAVYIGELSMVDISLRASLNAYLAYMLGGLLRRVACSIRPYEIEKGITNRILQDVVDQLADVFEHGGDKEAIIDRAVDRFAAVPTHDERRAKVAIFGDFYVRDNGVMNQNLIQVIEDNGGEVITTPYSEYVKMIASAYFRKWFNEGKYIGYFSSKLTFATMKQIEKKYLAIFDRILGQSAHVYDDSDEDILASYHVSRDTSGESMDNLLKIHYLTKYYDDITLFVQASPALCCASMITEAMRKKIEEKTHIPVVSIVYDGTGGEKNNVLLPYLKYGAKQKVG